MKRIIIATALILSQLTAVQANEIKTEQDLLNAMLSQMSMEVLTDKSSLKRSPLFNEFSIESNRKDETFRHLDSSFDFNRERMSRPLTSSKERFYKGEYYGSN
jgi:hypothetical protein